MRPRFLPGWPLLLAVFFHTPSTAADEEVPRANFDDSAAAPPPVDVPAPADPWAHRPVSLLWRGEAGGGNWGPLGFDALVLEVTPVRWVSLSGGAGFGWYGGQLGAMARGRVFVSRNTALAIGFGPSSGRYVDTDEPWLDLCIFSCPSYPKKEWPTAWWASTEASLEGRTGGGFEWRLFVGVQSLLDPNAGVCTSLAPCPVTGGTLVYAGTELGYAVGAWN